MAINPVKRELVVSKDIQTTRSELVKQLRSMKGKIRTSDEDFIECDSDPSSGPVSLGSYL